MVWLLTVIPQNFLSWLTGVAVRVRLPAWLQVRCNRRFVSMFGINMEEAERKLEEYACIEDVFTRGLKPGSRLVELPICSPADGKLARSQPMHGGEFLQAKGFVCDAHTLIGENGGALAHYFTVYLAPHNYHRVHAPLSGVLTQITHIPGKLWPVNEHFIHRVARIFTENERLVFSFDVTGGGRAHVVMVGAYNVGRMDTPFVPNLLTNDGIGRDPKVRRFAANATVACGDLLGTFMLGSTVVTVLDTVAASRFRFLEFTENQPVTMGQRLAKDR